MKVITISGKAQHGKDTSATILKRMLEEKGKNVLIVHYADYLKYICSQYFGWDGKKDDRGRTLLQKYGTDIARNKQPDFWVDIVAKFLEVFGEEYDYVLIPDTRFPNEIEYFKNRNVPIITVKINRTNFESNLSPEQKNHYSENALNQYYFDYELVAEEGLEKLENVVGRFVFISQL